MNKLRYWLTGAGVMAASAVPALAEGESSVATTLKTNLDSLQGEVEGVVAQFAPFVVAIITALLVLVGIDYAWRVIRSKL